MSEKALVIGVDMVKFTKPGEHLPYEIMVEKAVKGALDNAGISYTDIEQAFASYVYGDSTSGQTALYRVGMTGIPIINVHNNCSSGSTALFLARQAIQSGAVDCVLAVGFEEMQKGAIRSVWDDRTSPLDVFSEKLSKMAPDEQEGPVALRLFGASANYYMEKYQPSENIFAKVAVKSRNHALTNPYAMFHTPLTTEEVVTSPLIFPHYLTKLCACPPSCGAAAAIVCSERFAKKHGLTNQAVEIIGQALATDTPETYKNPMELVGYSMTKRAATEVYEQTGVGPEEIDVIELHDCFTPNEVITYEGLQLCGEGEAEVLIFNEDNTYGGKYVVNPSGGLMSKGHPLGATGLAQCCELVWQLRGEAKERQISNVKTALQHNLGLGGAVVVTMYQKFS